MLLDGQAVEERVVLRTIAEHMPDAVHFGCHVHIVDVDGAAAEFEASYKKKSSEMLHSPKPILRRVCDYL